MQRQLGKLKTHLELNLMRNTEGNKKGFCEYIGDQRKAREKYGLAAE